MSQRPAPCPISVRSRCLAVSHRARISVLKTGSRNRTTDWIIELVNVRGVQASGTAGSRRLDRILRPMWVPLGSASFVWLLSQVGCLLGEQRGPRVPRRSKPLTNKPRNLPQDCQGRPGSRVHCSLTVPPGSAGWEGVIFRGNLGAKSGCQTACGRCGGPRGLPQRSIPRAESGPGGWARPASPSLGANGMAAGTGISESPANFKGPRPPAALISGGAG